MRHGSTFLILAFNFEEVNKEPVVYHWTCKMDEINQDEAVSVGVKSNEFSTS